MEIIEPTADAQIIASETRESIYSPLSPNTIRVFELLPSEDPLISGILHDVELESKHIPYEALSYCWGEVDLCQTINCDGVDTLITSNLHQILSQLRRQDISIFLWIDAICINQGTDDLALQERAQQITMMTQIFAKADRVIIHLGQTTEDLSYLLIMLERYVECVENDSLHVLSGNITLPGSDMPDVSDMRLWKEFLNLVQMPWFNRLWCYQEYVLAQEIVFMIGSHFVSHFNMHLGISRAVFRFVQAMEELKVMEFEEEVNIHMGNINRLHSLTFSRHITRNQYQEGSTLLFESVLRASRCLDVTDPRDRIYAVYALLPPNITADFCVDYSESMHTLEQRFSSRLIRERYGVWPLMYAIGPDNQRPSWTISLTAYENRSGREEAFAINAGSMNGFEPIINEYLFCAGGELPHRVQAGPKPDQITAVGMVSDSVTHLSDYLIPTGSMFSDDRGQAVLSFIHYIGNWAKSCAIPEDIFWRLLILDGFGDIRGDPRFRDKTIRDEKFRAAFQTWKPLVDGGLDSEMVWDDAAADQSLSLMFVRFMVSSMSRMRLAITTKGRFAVVPSTATLDDKIAFFEGVNAPFVLREKDEQYQIVGPCYVHEYMEGQILADPDWKPETLTII